jgi:hypothetical protein
VAHVPFGADLLWTLVLPGFSLLEIRMLCDARHILLADLDLAGRPAVPSDAKA